MKKIIVFGASKYARLAAIYFLESGRDVIAFAVDTTDDTTDIFGFPLISTSTLLNKYRPNDVDLFLAIGYKNMRVREELYNRFKTDGYRFSNFISGSAVVDKSVLLGDNLMIMAGVVIEPFTKIGNNNIFWSNVTICHDAIIGSHNFLAANTVIGGATSVGEKCFFGFSSVVTQMKNIANETFLHRETYSYVPFQNQIH